MKTMYLCRLVGAALIGASALATSAVRAADPLPSWNDGKARQSIVAFVDKATRPDSPDFVPPAERIAVFDNDGTLWAEQPVYFQAMFIGDRIKALATKHPEWKTQEPYASVLTGDLRPYWPVASRRCCNWQWLRTRARPPTSSARSSATGSPPRVTPRPAAY